MKAYLLEMFYMNYDYDPYEYQVQRFLLQGKEDTINDIIMDEIKTFEEVNKEKELKVEQYNLFEYIGGKSLKESESE